MNQEQAIRITAGGVITLLLVGGIATLVINQNSSENSSSGTEMNNQEQVETKDTDDTAQNNTSSNGEEDSVDSLDEDIDDTSENEADSEEENSETGDTDNTEDQEEDDNTSDDKVDSEEENSETGDTDNTEDQEEDDKTSDDKIDSEEENSETGDTNNTEDQEEENTSENDLNGDTMNSDSNTSPDEQVSSQYIPVNTDLGMYVDQDTFAITNNAIRQAHLAKIMLHLTYNASEMKAIQNNTKLYEEEVIRMDVPLIDPDDLSPYVKTPVDKETKYVYQGDKTSSVKPLHFDGKSPIEQKNKIPTHFREICDSQGQGSEKNSDSCFDITSIQDIPSIPVDPSNTSQDSGTDYYIRRNIQSHKVELYAPQRKQEAELEFPVHMNIFNKYRENVQNQFTAEGYLMQNRPFKLTVKTDNQGVTDNDQFQIPTHSEYEYDYSVDWGDSKRDQNVTGDITHTYSQSGRYTISINGTFPAVQFGRDYQGFEPPFTETTDGEKVVAITQWGDIQWQSMDKAFLGTTSVQSGVDTFTDVPDLSQVENMSQAFRRMPGFNVDIEDWDVSNVEDMSYMFAGSDHFNAHISEWDTSNVENMAGMFRQARMFDQDISSWCVEQITQKPNKFDASLTSSQWTTQEKPNWGEPCQ